MEGGTASGLFFVGRKSGDVFPGGGGGSAGDFGAWYGIGFALEMGPEDWAVPDIKTRGPRGPLVFPYYREGLPNGENIRGENPPAKMIHGQEEAR